LDFGQHSVDYACSRPRTISDNARNTRVLPCAFDGTRANQLSNNANGCPADSKKLSQLLPSRRLGWGWSWWCCPGYGPLADSFDLTRLQLLHHLWGERRQALPADLLARVDCVVRPRAWKVFPLQARVLAAAGGGIVALQLALRLLAGRRPRDRSAVPGADRVSALALAETMTALQLALRLTAHRMALWASTSSALLRANHDTVRWLAYLLACRKRWLSAGGDALGRLAARLTSRVARRRQRATVPAALRVALRRLFWHSIWGLCHLVGIVLEERRLLWPVSAAVRGGTKPKAPRPASLSGIGQPSCNEALAVSTQRRRLAMLHRRCQGHRDKQLDPPRHCSATRRGTPPPSCRGRLTYTRCIKWTSTIL